MKRMLTVVKAGGRLIEDEQMRRRVFDLLDFFWGPVVLVHGGGDMASAVSRQLGLEPRMHEGRRITDAESLRVAVMVYAGWVNKLIVAELQARGRMALGLSGVDLNLIRAQKRSPYPVDFGYVGDIVHVEASVLQPLLGSGITPVVCALTHDGKGQLLNTNADTIAASLAIALQQALPLGVRLVYVLDKPGVLLDTRDENTILRQLDLRQYHQLLVDGAIHSGMKPKLHNAFEAVRAGIGEVWIGNPDSIMGGSATCLHAEGEKVAAP